MSAKKSRVPLPSFPAHASDPCPHYRRVIWTPTTFVCLDCFAHCQITPDGTIVPLVIESAQNIDAR